MRYADCTFFEGLAVNVSVWCGVVGAEVVGDSRIDEDFFIRDSSS